MCLKEGASKSLSMRSTDRATRSRREWKIAICRSCRVRLRPGASSSRAERTPRRVAALAAMRANPGLTASALARAADTSRSTTFERLRWPAARGSIREGRRRAMAADGEGRRALRRRRRRSDGGAHGQDRRNRAGGGAAVDPALPDNSREKRTGARIRLPPRFPSRFFVTNPSRRLGLISRLSEVPYGQ